ncbi:MAG: 50S ribosomal protein L24 [Thermoplasmatota archaeon]
MTKILSSQPRKQRLARYNAPHHQARKQMASHLSEELLLKYNRRSMTVITGDEVKLLRGDHKGKSGKIVEVDVSVRKVVVEGVTNKKADGTEVPLPVDPSNLLIVKLNLEDKRREAKLDETAKAAKGEPKVQKASKASGKGGKGEKTSKTAKKEA